MNELGRQRKMAWVWLTSYTADVEHAALAGPETLVHILQVHTHINSDK
jgi:hypothetical protein